MRLVSDKHRFYASLFLLVISADALLSLFGQNRIVNWASAVHAGWVTVSVLMMLGAVYGPKKFFYFPYALHGLVFFLAFSNQFFTWNPVFNYSCMLFNLALFTVYFFMEPKE